MNAVELLGGTVLCKRLNVDAPPLNRVNLTRVAVDEADRIDLLGLTRKNLRPPMIGKRMTFEGSIPLDLRKLSTSPGSVSGGRRTGFTSRITEPA